MKIQSSLLGAALVLASAALSQHPSAPPAPQTPAGTADLKPVRIKHMVRGYFYASSFGGPNVLAGFGGWGGSSNASGKFIPQHARKGLEILVDTTALVPFANGYQGRQVLVRNHGPDTLFFGAQDSRLYMKAQALRNGDFADIEYLPSSWCGNSYHTLYLAPGEHWQFAMPKYDGPMATRLRLELEYRTGLLENTKKVALSHTFPGSLHHKQFSEKQEYQRGGIMDPYND